MLKEGIVIKDKGWEEESFYLLDEIIYQGERYYLVESEDYGEELTLIIDSNCNKVMRTYNGWDDFLRR